MNPAVHPTMNHAVFLSVPPAVSPSATSSVHPVLNRSESPVVHPFVIASVQPVGHPSVQSAVHPSVNSMLDRQGNKTTKIVHFIRNPFSMVLSNYFYHAQSPSPEKWGKTLIVSSSID